MTATDLRPALIARIVQLSPCHGAAQIRAWAEHWPEDVTPLWLLLNDRRGDEVVSADDRMWLGIRLASCEARATVVARAVQRAEAYAALGENNAVSAARAADNAAIALRAEEDAVGMAVDGDFLANRGAVAAAGRAVAYATRALACVALAAGDLEALEHECEQQIADLARQLGAEL